MANKDTAERAVVITGGAGGAGHTLSQRWLEAGAAQMVAEATQVFGKPAEIAIIAGAVLVMFGGSNTSELRQGAGGDN